MYILLTHLGESASSIQNLILTKTRNGIEEASLNRVIYLYINESIFNRLVGNTNSKKKLRYTHGLEIQEEDMVSLEELMLREEDAMDGEVTDVESDMGDKGEEDDMEITGARPRESIRARLE